MTSRTLGTVKAKVICRSDKCQKQARFYKEHFGITKGHRLYSLCRHCFKSQAPPELYAATLDQRKNCDWPQCNKPSNDSHRDGTRIWRLCRNHYNLLQWKKLDIATSSILAPPPHKKKGLGRTTNKSNLRQKNRRKNKTGSKISACASDEKGNPYGDLTIGLPKTSDEWICPTSHDISLTHAQAVDHREKGKKLMIPNHQRLLTVPNCRTGAEAHTFVLSVSLSTIRNAGRGLHLAYRGPDTQWKVSDYVDLGLYGPHRASDIKEDFMMQIKSFIYHNHPSEWSFDAPPPKMNGANEDQERSEELQAQGLTIHGKKIVKDMCFDITDDATGKVHETAKKTLLPFANEVTVQGKRSSQKPKQVQNIDAAHHDDGTLHYLIRSGSCFDCDKTTELFIYYGDQYEHCRHRKHAEYNDNKDGLRPVEVIKTGSAAGDAEDMSTITDPQSQDGGVMVPMTASGHTIHQSVCPSCSEHNTKVCVKTTAIVSQYTDIHKSIFTYTEKDVIAILDFFLESPPIDSVPRQRMWWIVSQITAYLTQTLYSNDGGTVPCAVKNKLNCAIALFPRGKHDPHHDEDARTMKKYQYMGVAIRKETEDAGFKSGFVEEIVTSRAHGRHGTSDGDDEDKGEHDEDESIPKKYLVVYFSHKEQEVVTEDEIIQNKRRIPFDMVG